MSEDDALAVSGSDERGWKAPRLGEPDLDVPGSDFPLPSISAAWRDPKTGHAWVVEFDLVLRSGRAEWCGVKVTWNQLEAGSGGEDGGAGDDEVPGGLVAPWRPPVLTVSAMRRIPFARLYEAALATRPQVAANLARMGAEEAARLRQELGVANDAHGPVVARLKSPRSRGRRPRFGEGHFREVAAVYSEAQTAPRQAVAKTFHLSPSAAAKHVAKARALGFLPETARGVARRAESEQAG